ncbi:MAG: A/G-specific adenine glycosylase [Clostridiales bacterium]|nr:A/G-specific adenine glycosylase [Clostridiales bacterium]
MGTQEKQAAAALAARLTGEAERLTGLAEPLLCWYDRQVRELPWRESPDPYRVWVSEIMLQQTRIEAVLPYYDRFMKALPDVPALAAADEDTLMKLWEGLGYYSRARNLQKAARLLMERYGGQLPADYGALLTLPGVGEYTAGAVASISFGVPVPAVDGNVLRVLARLTNSREDVMKPAVRRAFTALAAALVPPARPGDYNQAVMELGETVCLPHTEPICTACPLADRCAGRAAGCARELPVRSAPRERRREQRTVLVLVERSERGHARVLLHRREQKGLLSGLWELPGVEGELTEEQALALAAGYGLTAERPVRLPDGRHVFSHVEWVLRGWYAEGTRDPAVLPDGCRWTDTEELRETCALPGAFRTYTRPLPGWLTGPGPGGAAAEGG